MTADFLTFCHAAGLLPKSIEADGRWHRCPTEAKPRSGNGAYKLAFDGGVGFAQDWAIHPEPLTWKPDEAIRIPKVSRAELARRQAEERRKTAEAIAAAHRFFNGCAPLRDGHAYLQAKGLDMTGCHGLRVDADGWLVVPMFIGDRFASVQRIALDGEKRFWPGAPTRGAYYVVRRAGASLTAFCEGVATGLCIFAAVPTCNVVITFNAGNLPKVAESFPRIAGLVSVAADNDHETAERIGRNPGIEAGEEAARLLGCRVAAPDRIAGTDWLDFRQERIEAARQVRRRQADITIKRDIDGLINSAIVRASAIWRAR